MAPKFDLFFACAPKDYRKLPYVVGSVVENIEGFDNVMICSPTEIDKEILSEIPVMHYCYNDASVLPIDRNGWQFRPNWCYQQHLKMFQPLTSEWWLTMDCDTIVNRPIPMFNGDKPIYWRGMDQHFQPYFTFQEQMLGFGKVESHSCIADMNLFCRSVIESMLAYSGHSRESFCRKSQRITTKDCVMAEPELYGNYVAKFYPNMYEPRNLKQAPFRGKSQSDRFATVWSDEEVRAMIEEFKGQDVDTFSFHSWFDEGDQL